MSENQLNKEDQLFIHLVNTFVQSAWISLGKVKNPVSDELERNVDQASYYIDLLDMLQTKMKGNLSEWEEQYILHSLSELKLNYIDEKKKKEPEADSIESKEESGYLDKLPKKETAILKKELDKLRKNLNGIKDMKRLPDLVLIVDQKRESTAIQECMTLGIPIISILDSNCNPDITNIPIPGNDDAIRSIKLIVGKIADSICEGQSGKTQNEGREEAEIA